MEGTKSLKPDHRSLALVEQRERERFACNDELQRELKVPLVFDLATLSTWEAYKIQAPIIALISRVLRL
jgi:hypothetical protein